MTPSEAKNKGDALEDAVRGIETAILRSSPGFAGGTFVIEPNKIIVVDGVKHEIDLHVTATLGPAYEAVFIFECKNWEDKVGKNEIIVFSEKVRASRAQRGFFVARGLTADAIAQAGLDPRIELLKASELDPAGIVVPASFHGVSVGKTTANVVLHGGDHAGTKELQINAAEVAVVVGGAAVDGVKFVEDVITSARDGRMNSFPSGLIAEGVHSVEFAGERAFADGEATIDGKPIRRVVVTGNVEVTVKRAVVVSAFEIETRGRQITVKVIRPFGEILATFVEVPSAIPPAPTA